MPDERIGRAVSIRAARRRGHRTPGALTGRADCGGLRAMEIRMEEFERLVSAVLNRWMLQNGHQSPADRAVQGIAARLGDMVLERGLPRSGPVAGDGTVRPMAEPELVTLVRRVIGELPADPLSEPVRQLLKACFYPEPAVCRDSFRETTSNGRCRRQELDRVRTRISGSHCVDCPHWAARDAVGHRQFLAAEWRTNPAEFLAHRQIFLPEDFRALRAWLKNSGLGPANEIRPEPG